MEEFYKDTLRFGCLGCFKNFQLCVPVGSRASFGPLESGYVHLQLGRSSRASEVLLEANCSMWLSGTFEVEKSCSLPSDVGRSRC